MRPFRPTQQKMGSAAGIAQPGGHESNLRTQRPTPPKRVLANVAKSASGGPFHTLLRNVLPATAQLSGTGNARCAGWMMKTQGDAQCI